MERMNDKEHISLIIAATEYAGKISAQKARIEGFADGFCACISALERQNPGMKIDKTILLNEFKGLLNK